MGKIIIVVFIVGYLAIVFEHSARINKAASALLVGILCWTVYIVFSTDKELVSHQLIEHLGEIASIVFFLLGAMVLVELIDLHDGFEIITQRIRTTNKIKLFWIISLVTFFLSAVLDNLTTAIVMVSLLRKLMTDQKDRLVLAGLIIIAANAGGAWSPLGDVTTTMLWIGGQITPYNIITNLFLPSLVSLLVPLTIYSFYLKGHVESPKMQMDNKILTSTEWERKLVFGLGLAVFIFVPVFKTLTHLPPFMGILLGLAVMWVLTEIIHKRKTAENKDSLSVTRALQKIDTPSIMFFLGILIAVTALQSTGILANLSNWLSTTVPDYRIIVVLTGLFSAIIDNVPLVAAYQKMYTLAQFPVDHYFWAFLAYCAGTGGSVLVIGSAAGVAAMGIEKINFIWYVKKISFLAIIGYLSGAAVFLMMSGLL